MVKHVPDRLLLGPIWWSLLFKKGPNTPRITKSRVCERFEKDAETLEETTHQMRACPDEYNFQGKVLEWISSK